MTSEIICAFSKQPEISTQLQFHGAIPSCNGRKKSNLEPCPKVEKFAAQALTIDQLDRK